MFHEDMLALSPAIIKERGAPLCDASHSEWDAAPSKILMAMELKERRGRNKANEEIQLRKLNALLGRVWGV